MIGAELADRVSPLSAMRSTVLVPNEAQDCWVCDTAFTACVHGDFSAPETTRAEEVARLVAERSQAQTRKPGRPPKAKAPFTEKVEPVAPEPEVASMAAPVDGAHNAVEVAPGEPEAPVAPPAPVEPAPIGADFGTHRGVETLSPVAPEVAADPPRVAATSIPTGDPTEVHDMFDVPPGRMSPYDDPSCPDAVLISDHSQLGATGAWMTLPNGSTAALTHDVLLVSWQDGTKNPLYRLVGAQGSIVPRPGL